jgi:hypothetical protein
LDKELNTKIFTVVELMIEYCKATGKWAMYISWDFDLIQNILDLTKAAPYLDFGQHTQVVSDECGILVFDTEEEMRDAYDRTVGDDGPTEKNPYSGNIRVYALTCSPTEGLLNENT